MTVLAVLLGAIAGVFCLAFTAANHTVGAWVSLLICLVCLWCANQHTKEKR